MVGYGVLLNCIFWNLAQLCLVENWGMFFIFCTRDCERALLRLGVEDEGGRSRQDTRSPGTICQSMMDRLKKNMVGGSDESKEGKGRYLAKDSLTISQQRNLIFGKGGMEFASWHWEENIFNNEGKGKKENWEDGKGFGRHVALDGRSMAEKAEKCTNPFFSSNEWKNGGHDGNQSWTTGMKALKLRTSLRERMEISSNEGMKMQGEKVIEKFVTEKVVVQLGPFVPPVAEQKESSKEYSRPFTPHEEEVMGYARMREEMKRKGCSVFMKTVEKKEVFMGKGAWVTDDEGSEGNVEEVVTPVGAWITDGEDEDLKTHDENELGEKNLGEGWLTDKAVSEDDEEEEDGGEMFWEDELLYPPGHMGEAPCGGMEGKLNYMEGTEGLPYEAFDGSLLLGADLPAHEKEKVKNKKGGAKGKKLRVRGMGGKRTLK